MSEPLFIPAPFFFLRAPRFALEDLLNFLEKKDWMDAIFHLYDHDPLFQEAILIASPSLHESLQKTQSKRTEPMAISLMNYFSRMATRTIPFGLFSFVGFGKWGKRTLSFDLKKVQKRARPDMTWMYTWIQKIYEDETHFPTLSVRTNPLLRETQNRYYLSYVRYKENSEKMGSEQFSIRKNKLFQALFELAKNPKSATQLVKDLDTLLPDLEQEKVYGVIRQLFNQQFLLPALIPSLLSLSPFEDLLSELSISSIHSNILPKWITYRSNGNKENLEILQKEMLAATSAKTFVQIDSFYHQGSLELPEEVGIEMGRAAELQWKLSTRLSRSNALEKYHQKFIEQYGTSRTISLLELLDEESGLGPLETNAVFMENGFSKHWQHWLYQKWQQCIQEGISEIEITEAIVDSIFAASKEKPPSPEKALLSFDLFCKIIASSPEKIEQGDYLLSFIQSTWQGGSSIGRFVDLLEEKEREELRHFFKKEEALEEKALFVELSFWPITGHNANVCAHPCFRKMRIDLTEKKRDSNHLSLEDIYVGATSERLYLTIKTGEFEIIPRIGNLLNPALAPLPFQFMREISQMRFDLLYSASWGPLLKEAIFLPRIRFSKTILAPAQWNFFSSHFHRQSPTQIASQFQTLASRWKLPKTCFLVRNDQHLLIDWSHPAHLQEILAKLKKGDSLQFLEFLPSAWIPSERGYHLSEIVIPFLKNPIDQKKRPLSPPAYQPIPIETRLKIFGNEWIFMKLYLSEGKVSRFLVDQLLPLIETLHREVGITESFFLRYRDPESHIRFRIRIKNFEELSPLFAILKDYSQRWIQEGLVKDVSFNSYEREIERYGGIDLIEFAETLFCKDSISTLYLLRASLYKWIALPEPILHPLSIINFLMGFEFDSAEIIRLLSFGVDQQEALKGFREHKGALLKEIRTIENHPYFQEARKFTKESQMVFREKVKEKDSSSIYHSLIHMHCNRLGCTLDIEPRARLYALHVLMALSHLQTEKPCYK